MHILVLGAYGLIGSVVLAHLHAAGRAVTGLGRDVTAARRRFPFARWIEADLGRLRDEASWAPHLAGVEAIVNCAGVLQDSPRDDVRAVQTEGTLALYRAATAAGIRRVVHVSAAGVGPAAPGDAALATAFNATKQEAEAGLQALDLDWFILRPGLVLSPGAYGGSALLRALAAFPFVVPCVHGSSIIHTVAASDVAEAALRAIDPATPARQSVDLLHEAPTRLADVLTELRGWLGLKPARILDLPALFARPVAWGADVLAQLGWRSPLRSTALAMLGAGIRGDAAACRRAFGFEPKSLAATLAAQPSGVQDKWFSRLYLLKPVLLGLIGLFWLASGAIGLVSLDQAAATVTAPLGSPALATAGVVAGSFLDIALGAAVLHRRSAAAGLAGTIVLSIGYLLAGSVARPDLWLDPLGAFVKVLPAIGLSLATLAILDER